MVQKIVTDFSVIVDFDKHSVMGSLAKKTGQSIFGLLISHIAAPGSIFLRKPREPGSPMGYLPNGEVTFEQKEAGKFSSSHKRSTQTLADNFPRAISREMEASD
jgi:hypothetical protein